MSPFDPPSLNSQPVSPESSRFTLFPPSIFFPPTAPTLAVGGSSFQLLQSPEYLALRLPHRPRWTGILLLSSRLACRDGRAHTSLCWSPVCQSGQATPSSLLLFLLDCLAMQQANIARLVPDSIGGYSQSGCFTDCDNIPCHL